MKKEFYIGQPLIIKGTGEKVVLLNNDGKSIRSISVWNGNERIYCHSDDLEPSTEFKFSQIIAGLEQGYFEAGVQFVNHKWKGLLVETKEGVDGMSLIDPQFGGPISLGSRLIHEKWTLVEPRKEMTLEEIEAELGYKIKLKDNGGN